MRDQFSTFFVGVMGALVLVSVLNEARSWATTSGDLPSGRDHRAACEAYCADAGGELVELQAQPGASTATCVCLVAEDETDAE
jgi:putative hemolysin